MERSLQQEQSVPAAKGNFSFVVTATGSAMMVVKNPASNQIENVILEMSRDFGPHSRTTPNNKFVFRRMER